MKTIIRNLILKYIFKFIFNYHLLFIWSNGMQFIFYNKKSFPFCCFLYSVFAFFFFFSFKNTSVPKGMSTLSFLLKMHTTEVGFLLIAILLHVSFFPKNFSSDLCGLLSFLLSLDFNTWECYHFSQILLKE